MARHLILIISILLLVSCGSRRVNISRLNTEIKTDSSVVVKIDGTYTKESDIVIDEATEELEYKPADTSKPMVINGRTYKNTIIKSIRKNKVTVDKTKVESIILVAKKISIKKVAIKKAIEKSSKKANGYGILILIVCLVLLFTYLWKNRFFILRIIRL
jgi:hypothetical protein